MVFVEHERGSIFYTCFHNRAQATEHERRLLQLFILKQIGTTSHVSLEQAGRSVGIKVAEIKKEFRIR